MIPFTPSQPFPCVVPGEQSMRAAQEHSQKVDEWLGLRVDAVEDKLVEKNGCHRAPGASGEKQALWLGLDPRQLLTPYSEIRYWFSILKPQPGQTVIDLGAAYGRMAFVLEWHYPQVDFIGYEYVGERVHEGQRVFRNWNLKRSRLIHADLASPSVKLPAADFFFLYDFGTTKAIEKNLFDIKRIATTKPIYLIIRGRRCYEAIYLRHPWLKPVNPEGAAAYSTIYRSADELRSAMEIPPNGPP